MGAGDAPPPTVRPPEASAGTAIAAGSERRIARLFTKAPRVARMLAMLPRHRLDSPRPGAHTHPVVVSKCSLTQTRQQAAESRATRLSRLGERGAMPRH